ncbi:unnamed protein product, partial [Laminaria digitata]
MAQPPIDQIRMGNLSVAIWRNLDAQENPFYICTFSRSYTDSEGNWQEACSFGRGDLLRLAKLADQAHSRVESLIQEGRVDASQIGNDQP